MTRFREGVSLKAFLRPRRWFAGVALLLVFVLSSCTSIVTGEAWAGLSTDGKYIYGAYKNHIFRINPGDTTGSVTDRRIEWMAQTPADTSHMYAPPMKSDDGVLYEGTFDKKIYAFTVGNGLLTTWAAPTTPDKIVGSAAIQGNLVYFGMGDKGVRAYDRRTGAERWSYADTAYGVWSTPVVVNDTVYFASLDHFLYAVAAETGKFDWKVDLGGAVAGNPRYDNGIFYIGTLNNQIVSVSLQTRQIVTRFTTRGWVWGTPLLKDNTLYFGDLAGYVYALDSGTFKLKWEATDTERPGGIRGSIGYATTSKNENIVIAGSESKYLRAYDAQDGHSVWTSAISAEDQILGDLIVINSDVIFTTVSEKQLVAAFNIDTGQKTWSVSYTDEVNRIQTATNPPLPTDTPKAAATGTSPAATAAATSSAQ